MDYSYIDGLLERYWQCSASQEEEQVLRAFFRQREVPPRLEPYRCLFAYEDLAAEISLGAEFDERVAKMVERPVVKARRIPMSHILKPFLKAAAAVAIVLTIGNAAQHSFGGDEPAAPDYNYSTYKDTYSDPQVAYDKVSDALREMSVGLRQKAKADSAAAFGTKTSVQ